MSSELQDNIGLIKDKLDLVEFYINAISGHIPLYTRLEYIESTGTQYIDTGYYLSSNDAIIKTKVYSDNVPSAEKDIISNQDNRTGRFVVGFYQQKVFAYSRYENTSDTNNYSSVYTGANVFDIEANYNYTNKTKTLKVNGETDIQVQNKMIANSNQTILLFKTSPSSNYFVGKMYYLILYENNTLVRNFIPAKRNSDNEIGLYDTVNDNFYTNQGTGSFVAGPEVEENE